MALEKLHKYKDAAYAMNTAASLCPSDASIQKQAVGLHEKVKSSGPFSMEVHERSQDESDTKVVTETIPKPISKFKARRMAARGQP